MLITLHFCGVKLGLEGQREEYHGVFQSDEVTWGVQPRDTKKQDRIQISTTVSSEPNCVDGAWK